MTATAAMTCLWAALESVRLHVKGLAYLRGDLSRYEFVTLIPCYCDLDCMAVAVVVREIVEIRIVAGSSPARGAIESASVCLNWTPFVGPRVVEFKV